MIIHIGVVGATENPNLEGGVLAPTSVFLIPPDLDSGNYTNTLKALKTSNLAIIACLMDADTLLPVLRAADTLGMISPDFVYVISADAWDNMANLTAADAALLNGAIVYGEVAGQGPVYQSLLSRWNTTTFHARYPLLARFPVPPQLYLYAHTCLDLLLRGFDRILSENSTMSVSSLQQWLVSSTSTTLAENMLFDFPTVDTVTGKVILNGNTRIGTYNYSYVSNGALVPFATYFGNGSLLYTTEIAWASSKPADVRIPPSTSDTWVRRILTPIVVVFAVLVLFIAMFAVRHYMRRPPPDDLDDPPSSLLAYVTVDIKSPAEKAMEILQEFKMESGRKRKLTHYEIDFIIEVLSSGAAFSPDIEKLEDGQGARVDNETRAWVMDLLAATPNQSVGSTSSPQRQTSDLTSAPDMRRTSRSALEKRASIEERARRSVPEVMPTILASRSEAEDGLFPTPLGAQGQVILRQRRGSTPNAWRTPGPLLESSYESVVGNSDSVASWSSKPFEEHAFDDTISKNMKTQDQVKITDYLTVWYHSWNFDMFHFTEMTVEHPLFYSGLYLLQSTQTLGQLQLDPDKFKRWLLLMESEYHPHPYHNATHAADVLHGLNFLLLEDEMGKHYTPLEMLALVLAAIGHDIDHPGYNNAFLVKSHHPWAILYCDASVLEFHHCAHLFNMTLNSPWNIFSDLTADEYDEVRKMVIKLILATDMSKHFEYINKFKSKMSAGSLTNQLDKSQENRLVIAEIAIKCADLGNPAKTFALSRKWTDAVMEEFHMQGDKEKELGLPVSQFMDRNNTNVPKCQIGFIDFLVAPLFDAWMTFHGGDEKTMKIVREIAKNRSKWNGMTASQQIHTSQADHLVQVTRQPTLPARGSVNNSHAGLSTPSLASRLSSVTGHAFHHVHSATNASASGSSLVQSIGSSQSFPPTFRRESVVVEIPNGLPALPKGGSQTSESPSHAAFRIRDPPRDGGGIIMNPGNFDFENKSVVFLAETS
ncbi:High affinity cAMP-specific and IBMX-insensitive 3',5'-cyclic phosphodiesterase 8B [Thoreauomyces humboldtii]|nr:High affinity cAMP-specific and IBMX-insensitive 3',5'-cyclic phosphodiesterase 8B [Thoreauomyces humboldtii]